MNEYTFKCKIMIINWSRKIIEFQDAASEHEGIINSMKQDLEMIESALFNGEKVILVFVSGSHFKIYPLFEKGEGARTRAGHQEYYERF